MPDLADFLAARLDEDEAVARKAADLPCCEPLGWDAADRWSHRPRGLLTRNDGGRAITLLTPGMASSIDSGVDLIRAEDGGIPESVADHIVTWDPARVLAEIAAKRKLLEAHGAEDDCTKEVTWPDLKRIFWVDVGEPCPSLRFLAAPYAGHPDYDPSWRIDD